MTGASSSENSRAEWQNSFEDPVRRELLDAGQPPDLDTIRGMFPATTGDTAFDAEVITSSVERLESKAVVETGHPFLDLSVKTALACIDATFQGDYPKYGVKLYGRAFADGFPPTIIAAADALSAWGLGERATQLYRYWLVNFVAEDGCIRFRGPSIAEYGQLLHIAVLLADRCGIGGWWREGFSPLDRLVDHLLEMRAEAGDDGLIVGGPEDDERDKPGRYFHNNAWAARGLDRWADICERLDAAPSSTSKIIRAAARELAQATLDAIRRTWPDDPEDWWLPPQVEPVERPETSNGPRLSPQPAWRPTPTTATGRSCCRAVFCRATWPTAWWTRGFPGVGSSAA